MAEKRQRDEGRELAGSPSFLSSPGGGNTGTGKSWKTHLPWKALPVCSSHRCKSHTPAYRDEGHTGNLQDAATRRVPEDKTVVRGYVPIIC